MYIRKIRLQKKWLVILLLIGCVQLQAQLKNINQQGSISLFFIQQPERSFKSGSNKYTYQSIGLNAKIPLFGYANYKTRHLFQTFLQADVQTANAQFGALSNSRQFINSSLGISGLYYSGRKNSYLFHIGIGEAADTKVIEHSNMLLRVNGSFIVHHRQNDKTSYLYGAVFTYAFGKPLPLPVLGIRTKLSEQWIFTGILPAEISFTDKLNQHSGISLLIRPSGNRFQFDNQNNFATGSSTVFMQLRDFLLAGHYYYHVSSAFTIDGEAGFLLGGKLNFIEQENKNQTVYAASLKAGLLFKLSLKYRFSTNTNKRDLAVDEFVNPLNN
jgi:hypothetical protein